MYSTTELVGWWTRIAPPSDTLSYNSPESCTKAKDVVVPPTVVLFVFFVVSLLPELSSHPCLYVFTEWFLVSISDIPNLETAEEELTNVSNVAKVAWPIYSKVVFSEDVDQLVLLKLEL